MTFRRKIKPLNFFLLILILLTSVPISANSSLNLFNQAHKLYLKKNYNAALKDFSRILSLKKTDKVSAYSAALTGQIYLIKKHYKKSETFLRKGLRLARINKMVKMKQFCFFHLGIISKTKNNFNKALVLFSRAKKLAVKLGLKEKLKTTNIKIIETLAHLKNWKQLKKILLKANNSSLLLKGAVLYFNADKNRESLKIIKRIEKINRSRNYASALKIKAKILYKNKKLKEAETSIKKSINYFRKNKMYRNLAQANVFYAGILHSKLYTSRAVLLLENAIPHLAKKEKIQALNMAGTMLFKIQQFKDSAPYFNDAYKLSSKNQKAYVGLNLSQIYLLQGQSEKALDFLKQSYTYFKKKNDRPGLMKAVEKLAFYYLRKNKLYHAKKYFMIFFRKNKSKTKNILIFNTLGEIAYRRGYMKRAAYFFKIAEINAKRSKKIDELIYSRNFLGLVYKKTGRLKLAAKYYRKALKDSLLYGNKIYQCLIHHNISVLKLKNNKTEIAISHLKKAVNLLEEFRSGFFGSIEDRAYHLAENLDSYRFLLFAYIKSGKIKKAWEVLERSRARSFLERLIKINPKFYITNERLLRKLQNKIYLLSSRLFNAQSKPAPSIKLIEKYNKTLKSSIKQLRGLYIKSQDKSDKYTKLKDLQNFLKTDKSIIVQYAYWSGSKPCFAFVITPDSIHTFNATSSSTLNKMIQKFRKIVQVPLVYRIYNKHLFGTQIIDNRKLFLNIGKKLYKRLIAPAANIAKKRNINRLIIIPDGSLELLPFLSLPEPDSLLKKISYFGIKFKTAMIQSVNVLLLIKNKMKQNSKISFNTLALGGVGKRRIKLISGKIINFAKLPNSKRELKIIKKIISLSGNGKVKLLISANAKISSLKRKSFLGLLRKYNLIHFATHGLFLPGKRGINSLILSKTKTDNGLLDMKQVLSLKLAARHVFLSACDTGLGKKIAGEGIISFIRSFMYAGALSVTGTLWPIYDKSTSTYIKYFYSQLIKNMDTIESHYIARQKMINTKWHWPCYWASFIYYGL